MNAPVNNPIATLNGYFEQHKKQLAAALPKHLNPDRMARLALTAFSQNKDLALCDPKTIFSSLIVASQLGLEVGVAGQGFLVPYKGVCTFIPGWQGYVDLVNRTGRATVWTGAVFEGDEFEYELGSSPYVRHSPGEENDPTKLLFTYAIGRVNGSEWPVIDVWRAGKIWRHRDTYNKVGAKHYSFKNPEMYARKAPLMQVLKYMPKSVELTCAMRIDLAATEGHGAEYINGDFVILPTQEGDYEPEGEAPTGTDQQPPQENPTVWPEKAFLRQLKKWDDAITQGRCTHADCIAHYQTQLPLSQEQINIINAIKAPPVATATAE